MTSKEEIDLGNINTGFADENPPSNPTFNNNEDTTYPGENDDDSSIDKDKDREYDNEFKNIEDEFEDLHDEVKSMEGHGGMIEKFQRTIKETVCNHKIIFKRLLLIILFILYIIYFSFAMLYSFGDTGSVQLLWLSCFVLICITVYIVSNQFGEQIEKKKNNLNVVLEPHFIKINTFFLSCIFVAFAVLVVLDLVVHKSSPYNLVSLSGVIFYVLICYITSKHPSRVNWRTVAWGFGLQALMAMVVLRWQLGFRFFKSIGDHLNRYFDYIHHGSVFIFGSNYQDHYFAMKLLPTLVFVCSTVSILFYLGVLSFLIRQISKVMEMTMNTTAGESVSAAGNIFLGQIETSIVIKSIMAHMTISEIHAIMTVGFSTIAGSVMAAFILYGVPANHLISASVMSAPCALAISKLSYPETKKSKTQVKNIDKIMENSGKDTNILQAASNGALSAIPLIASLFVNLVAFISILEFLNATLTWFGNRVGSPIPITFQFICSYALWPFSFVMGVYSEDCRKVAELIGVKVFINEFVAFEQLSGLIKNNVVFQNHVSNNGSWSYVNFGNDIFLHDTLSSTSSILYNGVISDRSTMISTYALCGFSNFTSIGIQIGVLSSMVPNRKTVFPRLAVRTMLLANISCFVTACIAGLFYSA